MHRLELKNLTKQYGEHRALDSVTVTLTPGVTGLLGANGAGKSTLMKLMTDNLRRTAGEILYDGTDILKLGAKWRGCVGYTPQLQSVYDDFSAKEFLYYMSALKGMKRREAKAQTAELLALVNLSADAHRRLGTFSGGMRQRALLAASLLGAPEVLILDEPTAGLDPDERIRLRNYIAELAQERIVLLATHVVSDIESIAGQVMLLHRGHCTACDTPEHLLEQAAGKIGEFRGSYEEIKALQAEYPRGELTGRGDTFVLRIAADPLPDTCRPVSEIGLEDVFRLTTGGTQHA